MEGTVRIEELIADYMSEGKNEREKEKCAEILWKVPPAECNWSGFVINPIFRYRGSSDSCKVRNGASPVSILPLALDQAAAYIRVQLAKDIFELSK